MLQNSGKELITQRKRARARRHVLESNAKDGQRSPDERLPESGSYLLCGARLLHLKARWLFGDGVLQDAQQHPRPPPQDAAAPLC